MNAARDNIHATTMPLVQILLGLTLVNAIMVSVEMEYSAMVRCQQVFSMLGVVSLWPFRIVNSLIYLYAFHSVGFMARYYKLCQFKFHACYLTLIYITLIHAQVLRWAFVALWME